MTDATAFGRCPRCSRILPLVDNKLPAHRVPPPRQTGKGPTQTQPLTGKDAPWCAGIK